MKKRLILLASAAISILLMAGMTACGEDQNTEQETETTTVAEEPAENLSADDLNAKMIGTWMPVEGLDGDAYSFGYMGEGGLSADSAHGEFCIQEKYVKFDGGGATTVNYEADNGKIVYTTYVSEYSAGGEVGEDGIVEVENIKDDTATINGIPYEKLTDDPSDPEMLVAKTIDSRLAPLIVGEWVDETGTTSLKLNDDGTMHYKNAKVDVDGTWESGGSMYIALQYTDPDTNEKGTDAYNYDVDNDKMSGVSPDMDVVTLTKK